MSPRSACGLAKHKRSIGTRRLELLCGVNRRSLQTYGAGESLPRLGSAKLIANALWDNVTGIDEKAASTRYRLIVRRPRRAATQCEKPLGDFGRRPEPTVAVCDLLQTFRSVAELKLVRRTLLGG